MSKEIKAILTQYLKGLITWEETMNFLTEFEGAMSEERAQKLLQDLVAEQKRE